MRPGDQKLRFDLVWPNSNKSIIHSTLPARYRQKADQHYNHAHTHTVINFTPFKSLLSSGCSLMQATKPMGCALFRVIGPVSHDPYIQIWRIIIKTRIEMGNEIILQSSGGQSPL